MMLHLCLEGSGFFRIDPLRVAAENAAFVIGVVEFGAGWADAGAYEQKKFCSNQHTESGGQEIDPESMPMPAWKCRAKGSRGIHAHSKERRFERDKNRIERADKIWRVAREDVVIGSNQNGEHQSK